MPRSSGKRAIIIASVSVLLFALTGCASQIDVETQALPSREMSAVAHGAVADIIPDLPEVPLSEALEQVGHDVNLPSIQAAGEVEKVALDPTAPGDDGRPGMIVVYVSGVRLFIGGREHDMAGLAGEATPFVDGRSSVLEPRAVGDREVLISPGGEQFVREGEVVDTLPATIIWNEKGLGYRLVAASVDVDMDELLVVLDSID